MASITWASLNLTPCVCRCGVDVTGNSGRDTILAWDKDRTALCEVLRGVLDWAHLEPTPTSARPHRGCWERDTGLIAMLQALSEEQH